MLNIRVNHPRYGYGTVISVDPGKGLAAIRYDEPAGMVKHPKGSLVPTGQVHLTEHRFTVDGQTAILRRCEACQADTPHKVTETGAVCGVCGQETKRDAAKAAE